MYVFSMQFMMATLQEQYNIDCLLIILCKILYGPILMPALE